MADTTPLETPLLDPRNEAELVEQALIRIYNASGGRLNDFSASSVARALVEGQCFAAAELLYHANKLPVALLIEFLKNGGVERNLGSQAISTLTFTLTQPLSTPFSIPAGFQVTDATGQVSYATDALLVIPAGGISGEATATCEQLGSVGNLAAYQINTLTQPLTYLSTVINTEAATGGSDEETVEDAITRGIAAIRRRNLVTANDYEQEAISILGEGGVAKAIGLLSGDKITYEVGSVHLFCLNPDGNQPNSAQLTDLLTQLSPRIQIGTSLYVSPIDLVSIDADLVVKLISGQDPTVVAEALWEAFSDYLAPTKFEVGASVILKEVEYALRLSGAIEYIQALTLNGEGTNLPMPYPYSLPKAHSLFITLVGDTGEPYRILKGAGENYV